MECGGKYPMDGKPIPCPNKCELSILPWQLDEHMEMCPKQELPCIYREFGCSEILERSKMTNHLRACLTNSMPRKYRNSEGQWTSKSCPMCKFKP